MIFFLDENVPKKVGKHLEENGHEFFDIRGTSKEGISDREIFGLAQKKNAVFITTDKDFFHTIPFLFPKHAGIIVIALSHPNTANILDKVKYALEYLSKSNIQSRCLLMSDNKMHIAISKQAE